MKKLSVKDREALIECRFGHTAHVRAILIRNSHLDSAAVEGAMKLEIAQPKPSKEYLEGLGSALVALLPASYLALKRILSLGTPKAAYEAHFYAFGSLDRSDFNDLEQDGIEHMLIDYLLEVKSTSSYAAWKAGLVLGEDWLSARSELMLKRLMTIARFPAGRMGAINGYRFIVQRRGNFTCEELAPLRSVAAHDKSKKVREDARFNLKRLRSLQKGSEAP